MSENAQPAGGLIVESRFSVRKELLAELSGTKLLSSITEAQSFSDGLQKLQDFEVDACVLGPSLDLNLSEHFLRQSTALTRKRECAFVKVFNQPATAEELARLTEAGLHGALHKPYESRSFSEMVQRAIQQAQLNGAPLQDVAMQALESTIESLADAQRDLLRIAEQPTFTATVESLTAKLRTVIAGLAKGNFSLQRDGRPSLATKDALRLAVESSLMPHRPGGESWEKIDQRFASVVVEWFVDRITMSHQTATANLRNNLIELNRIQNRPQF